MIADRQLNILYDEERAFLEEHIISVLFVIEKT